MEIDVKANKEEFIRLLKSTEREGVEDVIEELESLGFFEAPASCSQHLNEEGGLVQHSLNVCKVALMLREQMSQIESGLDKEVSEDKVIIASLLHDVCKSDIYFRTVKKRKTSIGTWEDCEGYKISYKNFPMGHGEKSVYIISGFMRLTREEAFAIRYHMGFSGTEDNNLVGRALEAFPLAFALATADMEASYFLE